MDTAELLVGPDLWEAIRSDLLKTPDLERAAVGFAGMVRNGNVPQLLLRDWAPVPHDEYIVQLGFHLEVSPVFWARAAKRARETGEALVILHSHPSDSARPSFSPSDDGGEDRLTPKIHARANVPVGALVVSPGGERARVTLPNGKRKPARLRVIGVPEEAGALMQVSARYDRQARALGKEGQALLSDLRVGVVGAGGLGSHVIQQLVHLGVGHVVVVEPDSVAESNLSRLVGAYRSDARLGRKKTKVFRRLGRNLGSDTTIVEVVRSVTDAAGAVPLLGCDLIVGCTDNHWSRSVLNSIAYQYYVPVLDLGVELQAGGAAGGRVTWLAPGTPCLWCLGILDPERVRVEQLTLEARQTEVERGYVEDLVDSAPAVVSINGVIGSLAVTELLARFTGFAGNASRPTLLVYRLRDGVVRRVTSPSNPECPTCSTPGPLGAGELAVPPWRPSGKR